MKIINHRKALKASINKLIEARNFLDELIELKEKQETEKQEQFDPELAKKIFAGRKGSIWTVRGTYSKEENNENSK